MKRREFLVKSGAMMGASVLPHALRAFAASPANESAHASRITFRTTDAAYQKIYTSALDTLARNTVKVYGYPEPVLTEGSNYGGIWLECAPQEGLVYADVRRDVARSNHLAFFALQKEDGQIPCWSRANRTGFAQIQMVVPIAATAWELSQQTGDSELLEKAYAGSSRWDQWLRRYRDTRKTGLCEGFCCWDTGHDNSPRWAGVPNNCPDGDARKCPPVASLPRLCPDLSATVYGGRMALAAMARALGNNSDADRWLADADAIRSLILAKLYSAHDGAFYDLDAQDKFVRVRGDVIGRVLGEHVVDQKLFDTIYAREIHNPKAFWAPYPPSSIAMDDPTFVRPIPRNSWGGASQALTALRAPRWMEHYGKPADLAHLMQQWNKATFRAGKFLQQMDPLDGTFTDDTGDYSPAALVFLDFTWRLAGVRQLGDALEWNIRPPEPPVNATFRLNAVPTSTAEIHYASGHAELFINQTLLYRTSGTVRLVTDLQGTLREAVGISEETSKVSLQHVSGRKREFSIEPNGRISSTPL
jgi:hypothetical protein